MKPLSGLLIGFTDPHSLLLPDFMAYTYWWAPPSYLSAFDGTLGATLVKLIISGLRLQHDTDILWMSYGYFYLSPSTDEVEFKQII